MPFHHIVSCFQKRQKEEQAIEAACTAVMTAAMEGRAPEHMQASLARKPVATDETEQGQTEQYCEVRVFGPFWWSGGGGRPRTLR